MLELIDKLTKMFEMQNALNMHTNGVYWATNHTNEKTKKLINWRRAAWLELAEFVDSFDWKHWKYGKNDIENAKTELVDIWHFMLSATLSEHPRDNMLQIKKDIFEAEQLNKKISNDALFIAESLVVKLLDKAEILHRAKSVDDYSCYAIFFSLCSYVKLTFDELYQRYMVKNTLNEFRQDNGYNDGNYIKIWHGKEDNVVALELAEKLGAELDNKALMIELKKYYAGVNK